jgi:hypothetical protein
MERVFTLPSELPCWELESRWTPKSSESDCKGQNSLNWGVPYIIRELLERRCLKWALMIHLDIWNTSYGQKKGRESKWQFDSWPLKVGNQPDFLVCRWHATYHWKDLDEDYNFALDLISIKGLQRKLWAPKVAGVPSLRISRLPLGSPGTKAIWMWLPWRGAKYTIRGRWWLPPNPGCDESYESKLPLVRFNTKSAPTMH